MKLESPEKIHRGTGRTVERGRREKPGIKTQDTARTICFTVFMFTCIKKYKHKPSF